jgi:hypothetical protein
MMAGWATPDADPDGIACGFRAPGRQSMEEGSGSGNTMMALSGETRPVRPTAEKRAA